MCSYNTPTFLFQPIELISLASILREWKSGEPYLLDSIAESLTEDQVYSVIKQFQPDFIVTLSGFECFQEDMDAISNLKEMFPDIPVILFGHYATLFPEVIFEKVPVDYIIHGEPDLIFSDLLDSLISNKSLVGISGISYRREGEVIHQKGHARIPNPNELPMPAFDLLKNDLYGEPFFPKPYGLIQSARGCPYQCNFCVKSYGTKLTMLTPENMILQIDEYVRLFNIKAFRFIDDTFTAVPSRVIEFCKLLIAKNYNIKWSCLSRPDTLNLEMLEWMKRAGCTRLYIGVESASANVLISLNKKYDIPSSMSALHEAKKLGFDLMAFFMVGTPNETIEDVNESIRFAIDAKFDFITVSKITPYPGTELFNQLRNEIDFNILPYENKFASEATENRGYEFQKYFFRKFYFNYKVIFNVLRKSNQLIGQLILNAMSFIMFILKPKYNESRKDYL